VTHRRITIAAVALLLLGTGTRPARAQDPRLAAISDGNVRASIGAIIVDAERQGLPREPLVAKALEGVEKGAPPARIETAVRSMVGRLTTARTLLSPVASAGELRAVVDALSAGVDPNAIRKVSASAGGRPSPVAIGVLAQLVTRGVPADRGAEAVASLTARRAGTQQYLALQRDVQEDVAAGIQPARALDIRTRNLIATLPPPVAQPAASLSGGVPTSKP
jgi:hypothetical protein